MVTRQKKCGNAPKKVWQRAKKSVVTRQKKCGNPQGKSCGNVQIKESGNAQKAEKLITAEKRNPSET